MVPQPQHPSPTNRATSPTTNKIPKYSKPTNPHPTQPTAQRPLPSADDSPERHIHRHHGVKCSLECVCNPSFYISGSIYWTSSPSHYWFYLGALRTCIVRMSNLPKKSFSDTIKSNMVLNRSALVPLYQGTISIKAGCGPGPADSASLHAAAHSSSSTDLSRKSPVLPKALEEGWPPPADPELTRLAGMLFGVCRGRGT